MSRDEQGDELAIRRQESALSELVERNGWTFSGKFDDNDQSAFRGRSREGASSPRLGPAT